MGALLPLLLNSVVAATPTSLPWFSFEDYPLKAFEKEWQGTTSFALLVAPNGKVAACTVTQSSGYELLDREACRLAERRARFRPAAGPDGAPAYGVYRTQVVWARPDRQSVQREPGPDLEVAVNQLPAQPADVSAVKVAYLVDAQGNPSACTALPSSRKHSQQLVDVACRELFAKIARAPVTSPAGQPVPAIKTAAVKFVTSN